MHFMHRHDHYHHDCDLTEVRAAIDRLYDLTLKTQELIMAAKDDLKSAIDDLATEMADNNAEIETLLGKITTSGVSDAEVADAVLRIRGLIGDNKAEVDKAKAATV